MLIGKDAAYTVANQLRAATLDRLRTEGRPIPQRSYVTTGLVAWDTCDCNGQLVVTIVRSFLATGFPAQPGGGPGGQLPPCELPYRILDIEVHITRCAANPDDSGVPEASDLDVSGQEVLQDAWAVQAGVLCELGVLQDTNDIAEFVLGMQQSMGPQGGCVGTALNVQVGLVNICPCD